MTSEHREPRTTSPISFIKAGFWAYAAGTALGVLLPMPWKWLAFSAGLLFLVPVANTVRYNRGAQKSREQ